MKKQIYPFIFFTLLLISACISNKKLGGIYKEEKKKLKPQTITYQEIKVTPSRHDNFRTTPNKQIDILHTDISVKFNWGLHQCIGTVKILLKPYFYETDSILLDAKSMVFDGILVEDMQHQPLLYDVNYDKKILRLKLEKKIKASDTLLLTIKYIAKPDEQEKGTGKAIRDDKGLYFINTDQSEPHKPIQLWTQGETESNSGWFPTIDNPNEKFTSTLSIQTHKDFTTLSNGELIATSIDDQTKTTVWKNNLPMPAYLTMMAIGNFTITKDLWQYPSAEPAQTAPKMIPPTVTDTVIINHQESDSNTLSQTIVDTLIIAKTDEQPINKSEQNTNQSGKEVSYYLEPAYEANARNIFANTIEMLQFFSDRLGVVYPWHKYAQVVVRDYVSGAMENTSATLHGEFVQKNNRELVDNNNDGIIAHELFHQWFGDLVTCESWSHLVLNEGFASFGEQLWLEHQKGADAKVKKCFNSIERYLSYTKENEDAPIVNYNYKDKDNMFNVITYQKGARVLQLLRSELGDDAFFLALKNYLNHHAYSNAEIDDLRKEFETVSGRDLRPFFQQWFMQGGHPIIEIRYDYNDTTQLMGVSILQKQESVFKFPLKFKVTQGGQTKLFNFNIEKRKETFFVKKFDENLNTYPNVIADPEAIFIGEIIDNKPFFNHILTYNQAENYVEKIRALTALNVLQKQYDTARYTLLSAINDADEDIRMKALQWVDWNNTDNYQKTKELLRNIAKNDINALVRAEATKILGEKKDTELLNLMVELIHDSSYTVAGNALEAINKILPEEAFRLASTLESDAKGKLFDQIMTIYSQMGREQSIPFFKSNMMKVYKGNRAKLIEKYTMLLIKINDNNHINDAINTFKQRAVDDQSAYVRLTAMKSLKEINNHRVLQFKNIADPVASENYKQEIATLQSALQQIIQAEKDDEVINQLKIQGLYIETVQ
ncbi:MAG: M1 family metallopeptidase [Bacteroidetes bacterium]|jgi:aminopeptidase N|nr:M1 family metallopeptidase [Bacteroidota bacterium]